MADPVPALADKVVALDEALTALATAHAFGGAIALAYYGEPRVTIDIDVNVFVAPDRSAAVLEGAASLGVELPSGAQRLVVRDDQIRLWWDGIAVDLFFAYDAFHAAAERRTRAVPFRDTTVPILSATDLLVCKVVFDRAKDWLDIAQMLFLSASEIDVGEARSWIHRIVGDDDRRLRRFDDTVAEVLGRG